MIVQKLSDGSYRVKPVMDANKAEKYMNIVQKVISRIESSGDKLRFDPGRAKELGENARQLKTAVDKKNKKEALRLFARNVRIIKSLSQDPSISEKSKASAKSLLTSLGIVEKEIMTMDSGMRDAPDFTQKMQRAKMNYLKKKGLSSYEAKNLKWIDGKLYHNGKNTGFTVRDLLR